MDQKDFQDTFERSNNSQDSSLENEVEENEESVFKFETFVQESKELLDLVTNISKFQNQQYEPKVKRISEIVGFDFSSFIFLHSHNLLIFLFF
jgi:hypothetical protein